jgi:hypothetical protein
VPSRTTVSATNSKTVIERERCEKKAFFETVVQTANASPENRLNRLLK